MNKKYKDSNYANDNKEKENLINNTTIDNELDSGKDTDNFNDSILDELNNQEYYQAQSQKSDSQEDINKIKGEVASLKKQLEDNELRHLAKIQNLNRIHKKELEEAHKFSSKKFAEEMLPIKDYLEMALQDQSGNFEMLKMGVDMTLKQLVNVFTKSHISEINVKVGDDVDPHIHNVVSVTQSDKKPNTILQIKRKGYKFHERVLRPTMVVASKLLDNNINDIQADVKDEEID